MANVRLCGLKPCFFGRKSCVSESMKSSTSPRKASMAQDEGKGESVEWSFVGANQLILMMKIHKKIFVFRDILDLAPLNSSASLREMVITTLEDLQRLYPGIIPSKIVSDIKDKSIDQGLAYFCEALKSIGESWIMDYDRLGKSKYELPSCKDNINMKKRGETMLTTLDCLIKIANEKFDIMEEDEPKKEITSPSDSCGKVLSSSNSFSDGSRSPITPKSVLPESMTSGYSRSTALWSLKIQALGKLNPIDLKRLYYHMSPPHMEAHKIEKEPTMNMEIIDPIAKSPGKNISQDIVLHLDLDTISDHGETYDRPQAMEEVGKLLVASKPLETPTLQQKAIGSVSSSLSPPLTPIPTPPPPPVPTTCTIPLPPPMLTPPVLQPNMTMSSPQPSLVSSSAVVLPPPPPVPFKAGSAPAPPPPMPRGSGAPAALPPPPPGAGRSLRPKATTKLKRSTQLGNLYRTLKGKVEGSSLKGKSSGGRTSAIGAGTSGKQGMADALAEMAKRSAYFQQIEEDAQRYTNQIIELRSAITNFKTKDMTELIEFHKDVESVLENLTDESQVLSRFEGFPTKKLEAMRMAAALYLRMDSILTELQNWKIVTPVGQFLDKIECYFNKIKTELDSLERTKDEESKKFKGHNIEFDFYILIKIKEATVDVSSNCMELALKERRNDAATKDSSGSNISDAKRKEYAKLLWRAFQFAFRVYTFAGGHDDRADNLTRELAQEIESHPNQP
ncbi:uncharacterized protein At4g04980 [Cajanus cajan]|uniref:uncharacterized protein At4g04980 n=1 Tax=Cajanus cajan TaxID=3821 RepID=UPI00098D9B05|nr:uncharacterized protein At4g04980 [Cajanus cajan]XP_029128179.1 uncharacterized protein At4g04980 [Cajanus cajan]